METPELAVNDHVILRPINRRILPEVMSAYLEDPQAAKAALPWLKEGEEARRQIAQKRRFDTFLGNPLHGR